MQYRFTLCKKGETLALTMRPLPKTTPLAKVGESGEIYVTQIIENYLPEAYFAEEVRKIFADAQTTKTAEGWTLTWQQGGDEKIIADIIIRLNTLAAPNRYGRVANNYTETIGATPLLRLGSLAENYAATVLVKLECMQPNSVKDRAVLSIVREAIARGEITEETEVVEASSGNVAFALAAILKVLLNKKPRIFISEMHGETKIRTVRVAGCPVVLTPKSEGTASAKRASVDYANTHPNVFQVNQHGNPDNSRAHRLTTGPELYHQCHLLTGQSPAEFVTGLGSAGTAVGVGQFRDDIGADFKIIGVEPAEASLLTGGNFAAHHFSGLAPGFVTDIYANSAKSIDQIETVSAPEGFAVCRRMLVEEGFLIGPSSGASIAAALRRAALPENAGKVIVTIAHDRGDRYLDIEDLFVPPEV